MLGELLSPLLLTLPALPPEVKWLQPLKPATYHWTLRMIGLLLPTPLLPLLSVPAVAAVLLCCPVSRSVLQL